MRLQNFILAALCLSLGVEAAKLKPGQKVLLSTINTLTLRNDQMTKSRRVEPIPQLKCVGGDGKGRYEVDVMRCRSQGSDYGDENISWACSADLPREFKLGATDVICEGYDDPDDNYVLKGSCGVEYRLALTDYGYEKYGYSTFSKTSGSSGVNWSLVVFWLFFFSILIIIIYSACNPSRDGRVRRTPNARRPWYWGGGGGGGGGNDSPPPYDSNPPPAPKPRYSTSGQQQGPGFWTGAAAGAAAGAAGSYLAGNRSRERERAAAGYGYTPPSQTYYTPGSQSGGGESSTSGETHSSTGFGQTRRR